MMRNEKIPNFFIVGAAKSGTTSIYHYLNQHPDIFMCPIKEPHYFSKDIRYKNFSKKYYDRTYFNVIDYLKNNELTHKHIAFIDKWDTYLKLFRDVSFETAIGEVSNGYLYSRVAASEIYNSIKNPKIIMILRNPIERAYSHYLMNLKSGQSNSFNFIESISNDYLNSYKGWGISNLYVELGLYYEQVKRYFDLFPVNDIKVYLYEDFKHKPNIVVKDIFRFLNLRHYKKINYSKELLKGEVPKHNKLNYLIHYYGIEKTISYVLPKYIKNKIKKIWFKEKTPLKLNKNNEKQMEKYFNNDIVKLEKLIDRDLTNWKS